jgi:Kef-type K+ transport system membrane component KefB
MKKFLFLVALVLLICCAVAPALAESISSDTEPFTWAYLGTIGGAAAFTLLVVQFIKAPLDRVWKLPTRLVAYVIALGVMLVATAFTSGLNIENVLLSLCNALLAALSAYGMYELTFAKTEKPPEENGSIY